MFVLYIPFFQALNLLCFFQNINAGFGIRWNLSLIHIFDPLLGLKENVIIGKLVPAGTGMKCYTEVEVEPSIPSVISHEGIEENGLTSTADPC